MFVQGLYLVDVVGQHMKKQFENGPESDFPLTDKSIKLVTLKLCLRICFLGNEEFFLPFKVTVYKESEGNFI